MNKQTSQTLLHRRPLQVPPQGQGRPGFNSYIDIDENTKETPRTSGTSTANSACPTPSRKHYQRVVRDQQGHAQVDSPERPNNISHVSKNSKTFFKRTVGGRAGPDAVPLVGARPPRGEVRPFVEGQSDHERQGQDQLLPHRGGDQRQRREEKVIVPCDSNVLTPWSTVTPITNIGGLWFTQGFGTTFVCTDLLVKPAEKKRKGDFVGLGMRVKTARVENNDAPAPYTGQEVLQVNIEGGGGATADGDSNGGSAGGEQAT